MRAHLSDRQARHASVYTGYPSSDSYSKLGKLPILECESKVKLDENTLLSTQLLAYREAERILAETERAEDTRRPGYTALGKPIANWYGDLITDRHPLDSGYDPVSEVIAIGALAEALAAFVADSEVAR